MEHFLALLFKARYSEVSIIASCALFWLLIAQLAQKEIYNSHPHCTGWIGSLKSILICDIIGSQTFQMDECLFGQIFKNKIGVLDLAFRIISFEWTNVG